MHLEPADLLEQLSIIGLNLLLLLALPAAGEQLTGSILKLPLPLAHLNGMDGWINGDLLDRLATTVRLHGDYHLEVRAMDSAHADWWEPHSGAIPRRRG